MGAASPSPFPLSVNVNGYLIKCKNTTLVNMQESVNSKNKMNIKIEKTLFIYLFIHSFIHLEFVLFCFGYRISLYNSGLPGTQNPPALNSCVLEFQVFALMRLQENKNNIIKYQTYIWKICAGPVHWKVENMHKKTKHHINKGVG